MSPRTRKSPEELREASVHLRYEWEMLQEYVHRLMVNDYQHSDIKLYNALLTAFGVHMRNLLDFFYPPQNTKPDDMLAIDYFDNPSDWENRRPELTLTLKEAREMVNKLNAHLTYMRATWKVEKRWWKWTEIYNDLVQIWNLFLTSVASENLGQ